MRRAALLTALLIAACGPGDDPTPPTPAEPAGPPVPEIELGSMDPAPADTPLVLALDRVAMGGGAPIVALAAGRVAASDVQGGEHGFLVPRVRDAVAGRTPASDALTLAVDPAVPYETVARAVYSAAQAEQHTIRFAVRRGAERGVLPIALPSAGEIGATELVGSAAAGSAASALERLLEGGELAPREAAPPPVEPPADPTPQGEVAPAQVAPPRPDDVSLRLTVIVTAQGLVVSGSGGRLEPGCERVGTGPVVTVPRGGAAHDLARLASCLERVHAQYPGERAAIVTADPDVPFADVARAIAVTRGTAAAPLFPQTLLAVGAR